MGDAGIELAAIYRSTSEADCREHALVLQAAGIPHGVHRIGNEFILVVAAPDAKRSRAELDGYAAENPVQPAFATRTHQRAGGWAGVLGFASVLLAVTVLEHYHAFGADWFQAGKSHAGLIRQGQWWRAVTALTLHADLVHLLSNVIIGGLIGLFAGQLLGSGLAWLSILMAGALGNFANAWIRQPDHVSVGASTAIFAALGLIAAYAWQQRRQRQVPGLARWAPLIGGVLLLSYLGAGGERTDVGAHVLGFLCGLPPGVLYGKLGERAAFTARGQVFLGIMATALLAFAWALALMRHAV